MQNKRPKVGVGVLIMRNGKLLMGKRKGKYGNETFGSCGGHLEYGESPEDGVKREVLEETGLTITKLTFLCVSNNTFYDDHYIDISFLGEVADGEPIITEPDVIESWDWYDLDNLPSPIFKPVERILESYRTKQVYNP
jgi:8-oxo-dGTP diphosphatase